MGTVASENSKHVFIVANGSWGTMKSKPMNLLFGVLTLVAIVTIAPHAFAATAQVVMSPGAGSSASADCIAAKNCFDPSVVNIAPGDTVTWTNNDKVGHTTTSGQPTDNTTGTVWDSSLVKAGGTYSFTFQNAGTYNYFCMVHPWMTGEVIVGGATTSGGTTTGNATSGNMTGMSGNMTGMNNSTNATTPEFGPVASLVLVFAIVGVVIMSARTRGFLKL
jgi:plastocyanin